jgi:hypothetical protein
MQMLAGYIFVSVQRNSSIGIETSHVTAVVARVPGLKAMTYKPSRSMMNDEMVG